MLEMSTVISKIFGKKSKGNSIESQAKNPEFRNNPENFHPCIYARKSPINADAHVSSQG